MPKKKSKQKYYEAVGRRRTAVARVRLYVVTGKSKITVRGQKMGKGDIIVNGRKIKEYFPGAIAATEYMKPLQLTENENRFAVSLLVRGGGRRGQLGAVVHGLSRALLKVDEQNRQALKEESLLTRDPRAKERRKVGTGGKARRKKQSPKR